MIVTIIASVLIFYLRSVPNLNQPGSAVEEVLRYGELVCVGIFTCELILRLIAATLDPRRMCLCDAYFYIDVASIAPTYIEVAVRALATDGGAASGLASAADGGVLAEIRWMQLLRLLRILLADGTCSSFA